MAHTDDDDVCTGPTWCQSYIKELFTLELKKMFQPSGYQQDLADHEGNLVRSGQNGSAWLLLPDTQSKEQRGAGASLFKIMPDLWLHTQANFESICSKN